MSTLEKCAVCGLGPVGRTEHVILFRGFLPLMRGIEPNERDYMRYRYRCANGHKWESTRKPEPTAP